jgi:hypothetical protein
MEFKRTDAIMVLGGTEMGKSTWVNLHVPIVPWEYRWIYDYNNRDMLVYRDAAFKYHGSVYQNVGEAKKFMRELYVHGHGFGFFDEADAYFTSENDFCFDFCKYSANRGVGFMLVGKRPKGFHPEVRARVKRVVTFQDTLHDDIEYLAEWFNVPARVVEPVQSLLPYEFIVWDLKNRQKSPILCYKIVKGRSLLIRR